MAKLWDVSFEIRLQKHCDFCVTCPSVLSSTFESREYITVVQQDSICIHGFQNSQGSLGFHSHRACLNAKVQRAQTQPFRETTTFIPRLTFILLSQEVLQAQCAKLHYSQGSSNLPMEFNNEHF